MLEKEKGIFTTRSFKAGEAVLVRVIEKVMDRNDAHASQLSENKNVLHEGFICMVNYIGTLIMVLK